MRHPNKREQDELQSSAHKVARLEAQLKMAAAEHDVLLCDIRGACSVPPHVVYDMSSGMWAENQHVRTEHGMRTVKVIYNTGTRPVQASLDPEQAVDIPEVP